MVLGLVVATVTQANIEKYDWVRRQRDAIFARAGRWATYDDQWLPVHGVC